jgi:O-antigen ligase
MLKNINKTNSIRQRIHDSQNISDLIHIASQHTFDRCAFGLLSFLIIIPVLIIPFYFFTDDANLTLSSSDEPAHSNTSMNISDSFVPMFDIAGNLCLLLLIFYLVYRFVSREPLHIKKQPWLIALLAILVFALIASLMAVDIRFALRGSSYRHDGLYTYIHIAATFGCAFMLRNKNLRLYLMELFSLSVSTTCLITFLQMTKWPFILKHFGIENASVFYNTNHFGYFLTMGIAVTMILMLQESSNKKRILAAILATIQIITLVENNTFGAYLAVLVTCIIIPPLLSSVKKAFKLTYLIPLGMFLAITFIVEPGLFFGNVSQLVNDSDNLTDASGSGRWLLWKTTAEAIIHKPFIGYGPEGMAWIFESKNISNDRPHNEILQYAASIGIPGLLCYLSALLLLWRRFWKQRSHAGMVLLTAACAVIAYFGSSLVGNTMFYTTPYFFMFLGLVAGSNEILPSAVILGEAPPPVILGEVPESNVCPSLRAKRGNPNKY